MTKKVYCKECKWVAKETKTLVGFGTTAFNCNHPNNLKKETVDYYYAKRVNTIHKEFCAKRNKNNNCKDYERK